MDIAVPVVVLGSISLVSGALIAVSSRTSHLALNKAAERIQAVLPSADCGICGYSSCTLFAQAVADNHADPAACLSGGSKVAVEVGVVLAKMLEHPLDKRIAVVHCRGGIKEAGMTAVYDGLQDCHAATVVANGAKICTYGCLGLGSCVRACPENAIRIIENGVAVVDTEKCSGCEKCVASCPRSIITMIPSVHKIYLACDNHDNGNRVKQYCSVGCTSCAECVKTTPYGSIVMENNLPVLDYYTRETFVAAAHKCPSTCFIDMARARPKANIDSKCDGCGVCPTVCPVEAINGSHGERHVINKTTCIGCGLCVDTCHTHAISLWGGLAYTMQNKQRRTRWGA